MPAPERRPNLLEIFNEALEWPSAEQRAAYLDRVCGDDSDFRGEVEGLLVAYEGIDGFLESPAPAPTGTVMPEGSPGAEIREASIGPYRLLEAIGEGGMGVVYLAEQTEPVRRRVALKLIKPGMDTRQVVARFEAERQALAMMDHPSIAKVHDAGTSNSGRPYFVMELVRGIPITDYCDRERLSIRDRLELFVLVCRAVQHAHQKGIIHRDIKPSNILVTVIDGVAVPKVIDFGVAKATGGRLTERTICTGFQQLVGTPLYMSPEQADLSGVDVDTRSDIYSLGIVLYELVTGTTPFNREALHEAAFDELRRIIREDIPPKPSARLSSLGAATTTVSTDRGCDPRGLLHAVRGDLDWIVMKALEKDRSRRYETANGLAGDLMRYLTHQPVEACPPSSWYRMGKFARRNRLALSAAALAVAGLLAGTAVSVWQAVRATHSAEESRQVVEYLVEDVFGAAGQNKTHGRNPTVLEVLDAADQTISAQFRDQPLVEASLRMAIGRLYDENQRREEVARQFARAMELRRRILGPEHPDTLEAAHELVLRMGNDRVPGRGRAIALGRWLLAARRRVLGPTHPDTLFSQARLVLVLNRSPSHRDEAIVLGEEAVTLASRFLGPDHSVTCLALNAVADVRRIRGDHEAAVVLDRRAAQGLERAGGPLHTETLWAFWDLIKSLHLAGHIAEGCTVSRETLERFSRVQGVAQQDTFGPLAITMIFLRDAHDTIGMRDLAQDWIARILATPVDQDIRARHWRSVFLGYLAMVLATLPEPIAFDETLAARAAEEAVALTGTWNEVHAVLGLVYYRTGQPDRALQAVATSRNRPEREGGGQLDWLVLSLVHASGGRLKEAREWYDRARNEDDATQPFSREIDRLLTEASVSLHVSPPSPVKQALPLDLRAVNYREE